MDPRARNELDRSASPYLRQHADNPVHWREWSPRIFDEARERDRPVLLSIGYAACHWCHVMAHESFEDSEVAAVMNAGFVNVKVDREERPEIDQIYMAALHAMGEQGGWPLTMFLTPDGNPFFGGTYFPKHSRYGRPGFIDVMNAILRAWKSERDRIETSGGEVLAHIKAALDSPPASTAFQPAIADGFAANLATMVDTERGGIGGAPKFPNAPFMETLFLSALRNRDGQHRSAFIVSLRAMLNGGIYDHVGGGLCRYATDAGWLVPHFEKMLYDNAAMLRHANWAFATTREPLFERRIRETVAWLERDMLTQDGAFASSLDADSEGEEGKYYVWSHAEIVDALDKDDNAFFTRVYDITADGNWEGRNIPNRSASPILPEADEQRLSALCAKLRAIRETRIPPGRDGKIIAEWNGHLIRALAECGMAFGEPGWIALAANAYAAISARIETPGILPHCFLGEAVTAPALSSDYAAMINAAVALHEATGARFYEDDARRFVSVLEAHYADSAGSGHYLTHAGASDVPIRVRGDRDEAIASATAQICEALHRLSLVSGDFALQEKAAICGGAALGRVAGHSFGQAGILNALALQAEPMQLVVTGDGPAADALFAVAARLPDPRRVTLRQFGGGKSVHADIKDTGAAAWLCTGMTCRPPIRDVGELERVLRGE
jgi:uncharacterized protein YyaL (SSP411 family)